MTDPVKPSPKVPTDDAPLLYEKTPANGIVPAHLVPTYTNAKISASEKRTTEKLIEVEQRLALIAEQAAEKAAAKEGNGKPVFSPKLTKWFFAGLTLCGAITTALIGDPSVPSWVLKIAAVGSLTFGGLLAAGPGFRKGAPK